MSTGALADFEAITEYYPGSKRPIIRETPTDDEVPEPLRWDAKPKVFPVNGVDTEFFTVGQLGLALGGRKPGTIRKWESSGIIPKATFNKRSDDPRGQRRLYSRAQVEGMIQIAEQEGILEAQHSKPITHTHFPSRVLDLFRQLSLK